MKFASSLLAAIYQHINTVKGDANIPVMLLKTSSYRSKKYGRIYEPAFDILDWVTLDTVAEEAGAQADAPTPEPEPKPEPKATEEALPQRRRRRI